MRRTGILILLLAGGLLALVWTVERPATVPLYDGLGLPSEPYRYLHPPPRHVGGKPPTSARLRVSVGEEKQANEVVETTEVPPQARLILEPNAVAVPPGVSHLVLTIKPVNPPSQPSDGTIDGNVYLFSITDDSGKPLGLRMKNGARVELRRTGATGAPLLEQHAGGHWISRPTSTFVNASYIAGSVSGLGSFAVVLQKNGVAAPSSSGSSSLILILVGAGIVVLIAVGLLLLRLSRGRTQPEETAVRAGAAEPPPRAKARNKKRRKR